MKGFTRRTLHTIIAASFAAIGVHAQRKGLALGVVAVADSLTAIPEAQRAYYTEREGKFHFDPTKLPDTDIAGPGYKSTIAKKEQEARDAADALKALQAKYEGIDPEQVRELLQKLENDEEGKLIAAGKLDEVVKRRTEKKDQAAAAALQAERDARKKDNEAAAQRIAVRDRAALRGNVATFGTAAEAYAEAMEEAYLVAREEGWVIDDETGAPVQRRGDSIVMGTKDASKPFTLAEWFEEKKATKKHWFPSLNNGGGAGGSGRGPGGQDFSKLSPTERLTAARAAASK